MPGINIAPTRSNLRRIKKDLEFARQGFEILDKKREVLTQELIHQAHDAEVFQQEVRQKFSEAYRALEKARLLMGQERVEWAALAVNKSVEVAIKSRGVMGVPIPVVEKHGKPPEMPYSLGDTKVPLDEASLAFRNVLDEIPEMAEVVVSVWRLANELQKTQRRVNALQHIFIPEYEKQVSFIENALEERERDETFKLKKLKSRNIENSPIDL